MPGRSLPSHSDSDEIGGQRDEHENRHNEYGCRGCLDQPYPGLTSQERSQAHATQSQSPKLRLRCRTTRRTKRRPPPCQQHNPHHNRNEPEGEGDPIDDEGEGREGRHGWHSSVAAALSEAKPLLVAYPLAPARPPAEESSRPPLARTYPGGSCHPVVCPSGEDTPLIPYPPQRRYLLDSRGPGLILSATRGAGGAGTGVARSEAEGDDGGPQVRPLVGSACGSRSGPLLIQYRNLSHGMCLAHVVVRLTRYTVASLDWLHRPRGGVAL